MENNGAVGEGLSYEDKLHVVCSVMGISAEVLLQRVVDRYYSMLVQHAGTFEDAVPSTEGEKNSVAHEASIPSLAPEAKKLPTGAETPPARLTTDPSHTTVVGASSHADTASPTHEALSVDASPVANGGALPAEKEKRTRRWASLPTEELDKMIIAALQQKGACSLKELTLGTGYTSTSRLLERAYVLAKQGMLEVVKEGRGYLIDIANRQLQ